jgi:antibiotic biosynthesis monooxygenase (ABM) superfamily enzyme
MKSRNRFLTSAFSILLLPGLFLLGMSPSARAQSQPAPEKKLSSLMHVFSYTPLATATPEDFAAFEKATKDLVGKIPGLRKVWVGKLKRPLKQGDVQREYGVAMEFDDEAALNVYATHPAHEVWIKAYEKVRVEGTTTIDILVE